MLANINIRMVVIIIAGSTKKSLFVVLPHGEMQQRNPEKSFAECLGLNEFSAPLSLRSTPSSRSTHTVFDIQNVMILLRHQVGVKAICQTYTIMTKTQSVKLQSLQIP